MLKSRKYAAHGVREYWLVDSRDDVISTPALEGGKFGLLGRANRELLVATKVLAGIAIDPAGIFDRAGRQELIRKQGRGRETVGFAVRWQALRRHFLAGMFWFGSGRIRPNWSGLRAAIGPRKIKELCAVGAGSI